MRENIVIDVDYVILTSCEKKRIPEGVLFLFPVRAEFRILCTYKSTTCADYFREASFVYTKTQLAKR